MPKQSHPSSLERSGENDKRKMGVMGQHLRGQFIGPSLFERAPRSYIPLRDGLIPAKGYAAYIIRLALQETEWKLDKCDII